MKKSRISYICKGLGIGLFVGLLGFAAHADDDYNDVFEEPSATTHHGAHVNPPFFENSSEKLDFLVTATPAYLWLAYEFSRAFEGLEPTYFLGGLVGGYLMADLASGIGHIITDSLDPEIFPESLADVFRGSQAHHKEPLDVYDTSLWANNKKYHVGAYFALGAATLLRLYGYDVPAEILCGVTALNMWTGLAHLVGHGGYKDYRVVKGLQALGLLITQKEHHGHHGGNFDRNFCVISGLMNPLLNAAYDATRATGGYAARIFRGFRGYLGFGT